ncbi:IlvD/Edd family dehydratase [Consotaella salsifontis]|uniref:Dihydroxyacid dehydratase n=1 Tax=Consotaella salsifontis TaxID=1365950 RepID=A0A1T4N2J7_9HYPH|nr:IlvD/Edd family dehydratase [Consotaella salsifontis]SJZ73344.1 dihydroxyacid dehydratase [Consotaella salsifontis]
MAKRELSDLRSQRWYAGTSIRGFAHRQRTQQFGLRREEFMGKPVIGIVNTWSEMNACHAHLRHRAEAVKRGVWQAGGYPVELPAQSMAEIMVKPTTMLYRNFLAMEVEELLRCHPIDGAVLLGGCDKSTPGMLMGAFSTDLPSIFCPAGPMSNGRYKGTITGAGTHTKKYFDMLRRGEIDAQEWINLESPMTRTVGTCNTMGTASTMTSIVDAMGLSPTGASSIPAVDSGHERMASLCGELAVKMVWDDLRPSRLLDRRSFMNGLVAYMALGGSTNAAIHLIAMAGRLGIELSLEDMAAKSEVIPVLANLFPSGEYLMEDFYFAGGLKALLGKVKDHLDLSVPTVEGQTIGDALEGAECYNDDVIRDVSNPVTPLSKGRTLVVLRGNLAPNGAVLKSSAADPKFLKHKGPALVFDHPDAMMKALDDADFEVSEDTVLVLRNAGPVGAPGMPEWGNLPIPKSLLKKGVRDIVRICDGRMSGTHYGTCVLHVSPEAAVGGPLALLQTGDLVSLDVPAGRLDMEVGEEELARRRAALKPSARVYESSFTALYQRSVTQADKGCDFDFLAGVRDLPEPEIY